MSADAVIARYPPKVVEAQLRRISDAMDRSNIGATELEFDPDAIYAATRWPMTVAGATCGDEGRSSPC